MVFRPQIGKRGSPKQAKLIGKIILSNFLELSLDKFEKYIETVERNPIFCRLMRNNVIDVKEISALESKKTPEVKSNNILAEIINDRGSFSIRYPRAGFAKKYIIDSERLFILNKRSSDRENYRIHLLLWKLRHINTRNEVTHRILNGITAIQKNYFLTADDFELKPLTLRDLSIQISSFTPREAKNFPTLTGAAPLKIGVGWISRIAKGKLLITPKGKELPLKFFFHKRKETAKRFVKEILNGERQDLKSGKILKAYSDGKLKDKLKVSYGILVSKRSICFYRKELGVPSFPKRVVNYTYLPFRENFSCPYPLTFSSIDSNAVENSGVYELHLANMEIKYENDKTGVFYIGSSRNLRKRLKEHSKAKSKNGKIRKILKDNRCLFRYIVFHRDWKKEEKRLYKLFCSTFGAPPKCNKISP
ncbi:MAG: GIY-YIG nuclease family protein [Elusimicrobia bacterium]|jgi:RNA polymerase sigma-54 factor|nr:GIY-YIG nuclease family protein [Elusimicrobiota bacterium]